MLLHQQAGMEVLFVCHAVDDGRLVSRWCPPTCKCSGQTYRISFLKHGSKENVVVHASRGVSFTDI